MRIFDSHNPGRKNSRNKHHAQRAPLRYATRSLVTYSYTAKHSVIHNHVSHITHVSVHNPLGHSHTKKDNIQQGTHNHVKTFEYVSTGASETNVFGLSVFELKARNPPGVFGPLASNASKNSSVAQLLTQGSS